MSREREEFLWTLGREFPGRGDALHLGRALLRLAKTYQRLQEIDCNEGLTDAQKAKEARVEKKIRQVCEQLGCVPLLGGDPRGCTVKLEVPSGRTNDFGNTGICVPG